MASDSSVNAYRLVYSEADLVPGLIVDRYGEFLVLQALSAGTDRIKHELAEHLTALFEARCVYERSDQRSRTLEGLAETAGLLRGEEPPELVQICEGGHRFLVDIKHGQKTGFFLDQRANRSAVTCYARDREVLDCFAYTAAFSVYLAAAGARSVTRIETSSEAHMLGTRNMELNRVEDLDRESRVGDAFEILRRLRDAARSFDMVVLDPPKFTHSKSHVEQALRGYKDINILAVKLLRPGGVLATFSCSGNVSAELFQKVVAAAAYDAGRRVHMIERLGHGCDHPVLLSFPESEYLKGVVCRVL